MSQRTGTYEVQNGQLFVNGESAGIDHRVVREVVRQFESETGRQAVSFLPMSLVERILEVDRTIGLARLKAHLHTPCASC
jgi:hypothetical protein